MGSPWIEAVRSVSLTVPDLARAEDFYTGTWRLEVAHRRTDALYFRGTGSDDWLLGLHRADGEATVLQVTLRARSAAALAAVAAAVPAAGGRVVAPIGVDPADPAGGVGLTAVDPHGRVFRIVHGDRRHDAASAAGAGTTGRGATTDRPERLTHVVLNSHAVEESKAFLEQAFGFQLADRTGILAFMNCNQDHHTLAIGITDNDALNHIAFQMRDGDAVMRGGGRMKDAGHPIEWGPGRHGPGDNLFNYFIDPFGIVIEYTAEVQQVDDSYRSRGPEDWRWPAGRSDQWGISAPPSPRLKAAQRQVFFRPI